MAKRKTLVRWQDGSYDTHQEKCTGCGVDHYVVEEDTYKEIVTNQSYHDWLMGKQKTKGDAEMEIRESTRANPDRLTAGEDEFWRGGDSKPPSQLARLEAAVATLTEKQRAVWEMVYVEGKTEEDAAALLEITHQTVHEHATRALAKVREYMGVKP